MTVTQSIVLGIVQGITEFLPISSSAHLILFPSFLKWQEPGLAFDVFLHLGTFVAIITYFFRDWWGMLGGGIASILERRIGFDRERLFFWLVVLGTIPAVVAGLLFHEHVQFFRTPILIAIPLASVGFLLYWIDGTNPALKSMDDLRVKDAVYIGTAQAVALIPGVSRSGSTMAMGRLLGLNREAAARFSFLLSLPITFAALVFEYKDLTEQAGITIPMNCLVAGFLSSMLFGFLTIHFLLRFLRSADYRIFAWYRILLAGFIVFWEAVLK